MDVKRTPSGIWVPAREGIVRGDPRRVGRYEDYLERNRRRENQPRLGASFVQSIAIRTVTSTTTNAVYGSNVTVGNVIGGGATWLTAAGPLISIAKSAGTATIGSVVIVNNPTSILLESSCMWYAVVTGTGSLTIRVTVTSATGTVVSICFEASGVNTSSPFRGSAMQGQSVPGNGTNALNSGSMGLNTTVGDFVFGYFANAPSGNTQVYTIGTGFDSAGATALNNAWSEYGVSLAQNNATATGSSISQSSISGCLALAQLTTGSISVPVAAMLQQQGWGQL